jgi:DHA1 family multidrug resistance protein-like MFS transporter
MVFLAIFLDLFGFGIFLPILPVLATDLGASKFMYGLLVAVYSFMQFIMAPLWGRFSDRIGRRPVFLIGTFATSAAFLLFGFVNNLLVLFLIRALQGFSTAATLTVANAYIADVTPIKERGKQFGRLMSAFGLGFATGPGIGGLIAANISIPGLYVQTAPAIAAASLSLINFIGIYFLMPESLPKENRVVSKEKGSLFSITEISKLKQYPGSFFLVALFALISFGFSNQIASFALYALDTDPTVNIEKLGYFYMLAGFVIFLTPLFIVEKLIKRYSEVLTIKTGVVLVFFGFILMPLATKFEWMLVASLPLTIGIAFLNPSINSLLSSKIPRHKQGEIMGINQSGASLMRVFGPVIAGSLMVINLRLPFYFGTFIFFILIIVVFKQLELRVNGPRVIYEDTSAQPVRK